MSLISYHILLDQMLDMTPSSPSSVGSSDSREGSPTSLDSRTRARPQTSPFLQLPNDIFKCVMDYLDRDAAWALKRLCRGMSSSKVVDELLYRYPIQLNDVRDIRLGDWKYRESGQRRWETFQVRGGSE